MPEPSLDPRRTGLLFFDTLKVYLYDSDLKGVTPQSRAQVAACQRMLEAARRLGVRVFYAQADHREDGADAATSVSDLDPGGRPMQWDQPPAARRPGAYAGSKAAEVIDELAPRPGDYVVKKHRWSAFHDTHLGLSLRTAGIDTIVVAGGSTEIGVASTAYSARDADLNLVILRDGCRSARPGVDDFLMDQIFPRLSRVRTVDQAIALLAAGAKAQ